MKLINKAQTGFTLIEIIIGIVVLSVALMGGLSLLISQVDSYKDPLNQEKLVQIMKRIDREIMIRPYDENINDLNLSVRCSEKTDITTGLLLDDSLVKKCTSPEQYGIDADELYLYSLDDVDDFKTDKLCEKLSGVFACKDGWLPAVYFYADDRDDEDTVKNYANYYDGFLVRIDVSPYTKSIDPSTDKENQAKEITVDLKSPDIDFSYKLLKTNL